jgi:hypothetical protein
VFYGGNNLGSRNAASADLVYDGTWASNFGNPIVTGDVNGDGYSDIVASSGTYDLWRGKVDVFTSPHSSGSVNIGSMKAVNSIEVEGSASFESHNVGGVEIRVDDGVWINCTAKDGAFNERNEEFSCYLSDEVLGDSPENVSVRAYNEFGVYMPADEYFTNNIPAYLLLADTGDNYDLIVTAFVLTNTFFLLLLKKMRNFSCNLPSNSLNWI